MFRNREHIALNNFKFNREIVADAEEFAGQADQLAQRPTLNWPAPEHGSGRGSERAYQRALVSLSHFRNNLKPLTEVQN